MVQTAVETAIHKVLAKSAGEPIKLSKVQNKVHRRLQKDHKDITEQQTQQLLQQVLTSSRQFVFDGKKVQLALAPAASAHAPSSAAAATTTPAAASAGGQVGDKRRKSESHDHTHRKKHKTAKQLEQQQQHAVPAALQQKTPAASHAVEQQQRHWHIKQEKQDHPVQQPDKLQHMKRQREQQQQQLLLQPEQHQDPDRPKAHKQHKHQQKQPKAAGHAAATAAQVTAGDNALRVEIPADQHITKSKEKRKHKHKQPDIAAAAAVPLPQDGEQQQQEEQQQQAAIKSKHKKRKHEGAGPAATAAAGGDVLQQEQQQQQQQQPLHQQQEHEQQQKKKQKKQKMSQHGDKHDDQPRVNPGVQSATTAAVVPSAAAAAPAPTAARGVPQQQHNHSQQQQQRSAARELLLQVMKGFKRQSTSAAAAPVVVVAAAPLQQQSKASKLKAARHTILAPAAVPSAAAAAAGALAAVQNRLAAQMQQQQGDIEDSPARRPNRRSDTWRADYNRTDIKHGRFSTAEKEAVHKAIVEFAVEKGLPHGKGECGWLIDRKSAALKRGAITAIAAAVPHRTRKAVWQFVQANYTPLEAEGPFTPEEDAQLLELYNELGPCWKEIGGRLGRLDRAVKDRAKTLNFGKAKTAGRWTQEEIDALQSFVSAYQQALEASGSAEGDVRRISKSLLPSEDAEARPVGTVQLDDIDWEWVSSQMGTRTARQCAERWHKRMAPGMISSGQWAPGNDTTMIQALAATPRESWQVNWEELVPGRTAQQCKRRWQVILRHLPVEVRNDFPKAVAEAAARLSQKQQKKIKKRQSSTDAA